MPPASITLARELLQEMSGLYLGLTLVFGTEVPPPDCKLPEDELKLETVVRFPGGIKRKVRLHAEAAQLMESECESLESKGKEGMESRVLRRHDLALVECIVIQRLAEDINIIQLRNARNTEATYQLKTSEMDYFLAHIFLSSASKDGVELRPVLLTQRAGLKEKVLQLGSEGDGTLESALVAELEANRSASTIFDCRLHELLVCAALNARFRTVGFSQSLLVVLSSLLADYSQLLTKAERDSDIVNQYKQTLKAGPFKLQADPSLSTYATDMVY